MITLNFLKSYLTLAALWTLVTFCNSNNKTTMPRKKTSNLMFGAEKNMTGADANAVHSGSSPTPNVTSDSGAGASSGSTSGSNSATSADASSSSDDEEKDPFSARASVGKTVEIKDSSLFSGQKTPMLTIQKSSADFVKILRCNKSYKFQLFTGEDVATLNQDINTLKLIEWAWVQATSDLHSCKIVNVFFNGKILEDITAPTGEFYYVINPCYTKNTSNTHKDDCSFALSFSEPFSFESTIREALLEESRKVSDADANLRQTLENLRYLAEIIGRQLTACENAVAEDSALSVMRGGFLKLGIFVGGFMAGSAISGPGMAVMAAQMGSSMGGEILAKKLGLGPIENTCLNPPDPKMDTSGLSPDQIVAFKAQLKTYKKYEDLYGVGGIMKAFTEILNVAPPTDGELAVNTAALKKELDAMSALDSSVVSIEAFYVKQGFDPKDPATFPKTDTPASDPTTSDPATSNPATSNPATSNPATSNPATSNPATSTPATSNPATSTPATGNSSGAGQ